MFLAESLPGSEVKFLPQWSSSLKIVFPLYIKHEIYRNYKRTR